MLIVEFENYTFKKCENFLYRIWNVDTWSICILPWSIGLYYGLFSFDYVFGNIYINEDIFWLPESLIWKMKDNWINQEKIIVALLNNDKNTKKDFFSYKFLILIKYFRFS